MLVLNRKLGERIVLGDGMVIIEVAEFRGDKVRLGIYAPIEISVHRKEVYDAIQRENGRLPTPTVPPNWTSLQEPDNKGHLVLTRHRDKIIVIGDDITVKVVAIQDSIVKLGITAPDTISVHRQEVYNDIQSEGCRREPGSASSSNGDGKRYLPARTKRMRVIHGRVEGVGISAASTGGDAKPSVQMGQARTANVLAPLSPKPLLSARLF